MIWSAESVGAVNPAGFCEFKRPVPEFPESPELLESPEFPLSSGVAAADPLVWLPVDCVSLCVGAGGNGSWPLALAMKKNINIDAAAAATPRNICERRLGAILAASEKVLGSGMGILLFA
jgi:hypothetical protein